MIHVYTGNGKGKTCAAIGLAVRAAGAGQKVYICQFLKGRQCSEHRALRKLKNISVEQFGRGCFVKGVPGKADKELAQKGFLKVKRLIARRSIDMVILDEIHAALNLGLIATADLLSLFKQVPKDIEIVCTGRDAPDCIVSSADLVSCISERRHYYRQGIKGRRGIEF